MYAFIVYAFLAVYVKWVILRGVTMLGTQSAKTIYVSYQLLYQMFVCTQVFSIGLITFQRSKLRNCCVSHAWHDNRSLLSCGGLAKTDIWCFIPRTQPTCVTFVVLTTKWRLELNLEVTIIRCVLDESPCTTLKTNLALSLNISAMVFRVLQLYTS